MEGIKYLFINKKKVNITNFQTLSEDDKEDVLIETQAMIDEALPSKIAEDNVPFLSCTNIIAEKFCNNPTSAESINLITLLNDTLINLDPHVWKITFPSIDRTFSLPSESWLFDHNILKLFEFVQQT